MANALGKLDELLAVADQFEPQDDIQLRNLQALRALIAIESKDLEATKQSIAEVWKRLHAGLPQELPAKDRAAEFVVAWRRAGRQDAPSCLGHRSRIEVDRT